MPKARKGSAIDRNCSAVWRTTAIIPRAGAGNVVPIPNREQRAADIGPSPRSDLRGSTGSTYPANWADPVGFCPGGTFESSPTFQRWISSPEEQVPKVAQCLLSTVFAKRQSPVQFSASPSRTQTGFAKIPQDATPQNKCASTCRAIVVNLANFSCFT